MIIAFPQDMTPAELFEVVGWMGHALRLELEGRAHARQAGPRLAIARAMPPRTS